MYRRRAPARSYSFGSRFSRPARKQRFWVTTLIGQAEVSLVPTYIALVQPSQWLTNATVGNFERCKAVMSLLVLETTPLATAQSRYYAVGVDDVSTAGDDPATTTFYGSFQTIKRWGALAVPTSTAVAAGATPSGWFTNRDLVRQVKLNRVVKSDENVWLVISAPASAPAQLTWGGICRTLMERG